MALDRAEAERLLAELMPIEGSMADRLAGQLKAALEEIQRMALFAQIGEAYVAIKDLDRLCEGHSKLEDPIGNDAEMRMMAVAVALGNLVDTYRAGKP